MDKRRELEELKHRQEEEKKWQKHTSKPALDRHWLAAMKYNKRIRAIQRRIGPGPEDHVPMLIFLVRGEIYETTIDGETVEMTKVQARKLAAAQPPNAPIPVHLHLSE